MSRKTSQDMNYMKRINPFELTQKIRDFRNLNIGTLSREEIRKEIYKVITSDDGNLIIPQKIQTYPKETSFFRARVLNSSIIPHTGFQFEADFWNAPKKLIKTYGRLNQPGESLLYTTPSNPELTLKEIEIPDNAFYALMKYEATDDIKVSLIGRDKLDFETLGIKSDMDKLVVELTNDFLKDEFSRDVGKGTEYLYMVSEIICKDFYDLPPRDVQDAWAYASLKDKEKYNVCFRPEIAKEVLKLNGTLICKKLPESDEVVVKCIQSGFDSSGNAQFYRLGTEEQQRVFPEIDLN